ncbi:unnamed protein product [Mytilus coruscus]|uniref:SWIM-type domain-containing protein n=1 Tax=Mytilus coruscus TaxID=42192 RepID=A0A6J8CJZ3_MYTCO|nr:unnamed protein product [Mytilus coruscus]
MKHKEKRMMKLAENVVLLDATYKGLTAYGYPFYALVARDEQQGRGTPLSYCISSDDTGEVVKIFLRSLKTTAENHGFDFCPRTHARTNQKKVIDYIRTMKICTKKEDFSQKVQMLQEKMPSKQITDYLLDNWCTDKWGCQWANYGRHLFYEDQDTNNLVESYLDETLKNMGGQREDKSKLTAENMLKAGLDQTVQWTSSTECTVPLQTAFGTIHNVDIVNVVCNCPAETTRGMCKHVHLAKLIASKRNIDLTVERRSEAMDVFNAEQYFYDRDNNQVEVPDWEMYQLLI